MEQGLKRFAKPLFRLRALEVFRDDAALAADPALWKAIENALDASSHLILMASPDAADSPWVSRELAHWLDRRPAQTLLIVLTGGEIVWDTAASDFDAVQSNAIPSVLRGRFSEEPRWIDLRWARTESDLSLNNPRFRGAIADLAAPLHGRPKDTLIGEDVSQHRRLQQLARTALATLTTLVLGLGISLHYANQQRITADTQASLARAQRDTALQTQSLFLADLSNQRVAAGDAVTGMLLALRALPQDGDRPYVARAEVALRNALLSQRERAVLDPDNDDHETAHAVNVSNDGVLIAAAIGQRSILWDARTLEATQTLNGHANDVSAVAFSPDDSLIATASHDGQLRIWQRASGKLLHAIEGGGGEIWTTAFSPDGGQLASGSSDGKVRLWDTATGRLLQVFSGHSHWVRALVFLPDGDRLASAGNDGKIHVWNLAGGDAELVIDAGKEWILALAVSPSGNTLISGGVDNKIRFWRVADGKSRGSLDGHTDNVASLALSRDARRLVSGAYDGTVRLWDLQTGELLLNLRGHNGWVSSVRFTDQDRTLLSASFDGTVRLWRAERGWGLTALAGHTEWISTLAFSPDDRQLATGSYDTSIRIWDLDRARVLHELNGHSGKVHNLAWSPKGDRIASGAADHTVRVWDTANGQALYTLVGHSDTVSTLRFSNDGRYLVSAADDGVLILSDARSGTRLQVWKGTDARPMAVGFADAGRQLIALTADGKLLRWSVTSGTSGRAVSLADIRVARGALSPSGDRALTIDGLSLRLWDSATGDLLAKGRLSSPSNDVRFSPDGRLVIVATGGGSARVIDAETLNTELRLPWASQFAEPIAPGIPGILDPLITAGMSHDGDRVAFAPNDNSVRIWFVGRDLNRLIQHARRRLPRCLTVEEETKYFLRTPEDADPPRNCRHPR